MMTVAVRRTSKHFPFMEALAMGETIGTDNRTCRRFGTNQVPDLARKAEKAGMIIERDYLKVGRTKVARYYLTKENQIKWRKLLGMEKS